MHEVYFMGTRPTTDRRTRVLLTPGTNQVEEEDVDLLLLRRDVIDQDRPDGAGDVEEE